jgi:hypothetical protein
VAGWFVISVAIMLPAALRAQPASEFDRLFDRRTMRVDYFHTGGPGVEIILAHGPEASLGGSTTATSESTCSR